MSQGVPGTPPNLSLQNALQTASATRQSFGYCPAQGEVPLRSALVEEMKEIYGRDADLAAEDIALTVGCNMAFVASIMSIADAGDEVILPRPCRETHAPPKTGAIYPPSLIASFASLAAENNIALILDETYRDFLIPRTPPHLLFTSPTWRSNLIHLYSFSKSYRIPGHRLGCIVASPTLITQIIKILDTLQICPPRIPQIALAQSGLLQELRADIHGTAEQVAKRHQLFREHLSKRWEIASQGGYYAFVRHPFTGVGSAEVCERLAKEMGVVVLPGAFFGGADSNDDRWVRFSVANVDDEKVKRVCERLVESEQGFGWELS
ncbi:hypothetical protein V5O48_018309 [Marasmius crinis-equi]|uniref:Aminotransferase class I/classII large domain-containing protein n=1 Tax=Marasmius crinis-equi TaxID=585013 RepID=A0ABR3ELP2_9AGAR